MSGDQERDAPYQHPTEREKYLNWRMDYDSDNDEKPALIEAWFACAKLKDKEIEQLKAEVERLKKYELTSPSYEELKAKLAMISEALKVADHLLECDAGGYSPLIQEALSATEQDVQKWRRELEAKAIEECANVCGKESDSAYKLKGTKDWSSYNEGIGDGCGICEDELRLLAQQKRSE